MYEAPAIISIGLLLTLKYFSHSFTFKVADPLGHGFPGLKASDDLMDRLEYSFENATDGQVAIPVTNV